MNLVIFGAQSIALSAYEAIRNICPKKVINYFLVTKRDDNPEILLGVPVLELVEYVDVVTDEEKENTEVLIATPENVMDEIETSLDSYGLYKHARLDSMIWAELMQGFYLSSRKFLPLTTLPVGYRRADILMFMSRCNKDKVIQSNFSLPEWIVPIQVGAKLCDERIAEIVDCDGENISHKNRNYSELTALYWMWKNKLLSDEECQTQYWGLVHYRRILELSKDDINRLVSNEVDVVLPFPMIYEPDIEAHHNRYLKKADWDALLKAIDELYPEYKQSFDKILKQRYFYNYNIILAKKRVLREYCEWLFPILKRVEELSEPKGWERNDRYIGYIGETLETLYFMSHKDSLNIFHVGCRFLI